MSCQSVQRIVALANQLRQERPNQSGVKGTGNPGYVKDGLKNAVKTAIELYYRETKTSTPLPKQTKTNNPVEPQTKTNNPVEPQMNIVQESQKRKGEELSHLAKRTRPTLLPHRQVPAFSFSTSSPIWAGRVWDTKFS